MMDVIQPTGSEQGALHPGLMMDFPLTVQHVLRRMAGIWGGKKVVTLVDPDSGECAERSFREVVARAGQLAHALQRLGVRPGDRVGSLAWNNVQHLEVYLAVMSMGAVLHTMNLRLHGDQLAYTVDHAEDVVVLVESSLAGQFAEVLPGLGSVREVIVIDDFSNSAPELPSALDYETLLEREDPNFEWPQFDERSAAALCYTSGTTGDPKGVLYSHRSIILHALAMSGADVFGITSRDRVLALVPLFHAMGWGLPFICGLVGSDIVMPGRHLKPGPLARLIDDQRTTWSAGVPTLWLDLLQYMDEAADAGRSHDLSSLETILCGGTAVAESLINEYKARFDADMIEGWGMTEIFPGATVDREAMSVSPGAIARRKTAGRVSPLYELRLVDVDGAVLPNNGVAVGDLEVRGPAVASGYFKSDAATAAAIHDGWLRTGDVGTVDSTGHLRITDRAKDVIKSGGEWISSQDLEVELLAHPAVREAAVIGVADQRWGERPLAFVVLGAPATESDLKEFLVARVARWWVPEQFEIVDQIPRTTTGKFDKKILRTRFDERG
ncbi:long-chain-fatty-acid--CoA ligase [Rhodococcus qingshengii]|uniref:long-chain-fatty-acid--CoA ligase n=1 Tax=Rhodococcus qingshengii TaxID=334542 RepID=UPI00211EA816|nr:long-chain-fatty-acid--CoA ligase [Rhodococcus qingshengii]